MAKKTKSTAKDLKEAARSMVSNKNHKETQEGETVELRGKLKKLRKNRHGEIDGLILADGSMIRFPVEIGRKVKGKMHHDDDVMVIGVYHDSSKGERQVKASYLECLKSELTIDIDIRIDASREPATDPHGSELVSSSATTMNDNAVLQKLVRLHSLSENQRVIDAAERKSQHETVLKELKEIRMLLRSK
jgi:hypothetical protein